MNPRDYEFEQIQASCQNGTTVWKARSKANSSLQYFVKKIVFTTVEDFNIGLNEILAYIRVLPHNCITNLRGRWVSFPLDNSFDPPQVLPTLYLFMEKMQSSLDDEISKRAKNSKFFSKEDLAHLMKDVAIGLEHLEARNLGHRDIKPKNVLLDERLRAKLCDFGGCKVFLTDTRTLSATGTTGFMAPEVDEFFKWGSPSERISYVNRQIDEVIRSDIYSYGKTFLCAALLKNRTLEVKKEMFDEIEGRYGRPIRRLLEKSLRTDPQSRITLEEIREGLYEVECSIISLKQSRGLSLEEGGEKERTRELLNEEQDKSFSPKTTVAKEELAKREKEALKPAYSIERKREDAGYEKMRKSNKDQCPKLSEIEYRTLKFIMEAGKEILETELKSLYKEWRIRARDISFTADEEGGTAFSVRYKGSHSLDPPFVEKLKKLFAEKIAYFELRSHTLGGYSKSYLLDLIEEEEIEDADFNLVKDEHNRIWVFQVVCLKHRVESIKRYLETRIKSY